MIRGLLNRREMIASALAMSAAPSLARAQLNSTELPQATKAAMATIARGGEIAEDRVRVTMPKLAENGRSVPLEFEVEGATSADVRTVHVIAGANPIPVVARFHFGPRAGAPYMKTRIRLADTQHVVAVVEMADGSFRSGRTHVVVTLGGCLDPVL